MSAPDYDMGRADERVATLGLLQQIETEVDRLDDCSRDRSAETQQIRTLIAQYRVITDRVVAAGKEKGWYPK